MCPHCESVRVIRHGHANGFQRYRCRECSKTFSALTGTPLNRLHKRGKWLDQAEALQTGQPLRAVAGALQIHLSTAHRRRHRFLALPKALQPPTLTGIAEADETVFFLSFKGKRSGLERKARKRGGKAARRGLSHEQVPVLVARDRAGVTMDCVLDAMTITRVPWENLTARRTIESLHRASNLEQFARSTLWQGFSAISSSELSARSSKLSENRHKM